MSNIMLIYRLLETLCTHEMQLRHNLTINTVLQQVKCADRILKKPSMYII